MHLPLGSRVSLLMSERAVADVEPSPYPAGTVRQLLDSDHLSIATRRVLLNRLAEPAVTASGWLPPSTLATLRAICDRLLPQDDLGQPVDIARQIDARLAADTGNGWRYAALPADRLAWLAGLAAIEQFSVGRYGRAFIALTGDQQDDLLRDVQRGQVPAETWPAIDAVTFFEEMLAEVTELFYADPIAQEDIGYAGMADLPAWTDVGLNELSRREPRPEPQP